MRMPEDWLQIHPVGPRQEGLGGLPAHQSDEVMIQEKNGDTTSRSLSIPETCFQPVNARLLRLSNDCQGRARINPEAIMKREYNCRV